MGFTRSAICGKKLVLGAPLLLSLSPPWGHPTEGHRVFCELSRGATENVKHEEFAVRAERRLEAVADRLTDGGDSTTIARAQELRVAALVVREEAKAVSRSEEGPRDGPLAANPPLEAQA